MPPDGVTLSIAGQTIGGATLAGFDLLNKIHTSGDIEHLEHTGEGTVVRGRVHEDLAGELAPYLTTPA